MMRILGLNKKSFLDNTILTLRIGCLTLFFITLFIGYVHKSFFVHISSDKIDIFIFPTTFLAIYISTYISTFVKNQALSFLHFTSIMTMSFGYYLIYIYKFTVSITLLFILIILGIILILNTKVPFTYFITTTIAFVNITIISFVELHIYNLLVIVAFIILGSLCNYFVMSTLRSDEQNIKREKMDEPIIDNTLWKDLSNSLNSNSIYAEALGGEIDTPERLKYLCFHDSLTGLYNRAFFEEELNRLNTNRQLPLAIIMGDVNGLKLTNDAFGHKKGDIFLKAIAEILKSSCREEDIIARLGGDEFAIILPKTDEHIVKNICERVKKQCINHACNPIQPSIALGYGIKNIPTESIEQTLKSAENMMYENKIKEGKNIRNSIISSLKKNLETKTSETEQHFLRVRDLSIRFAHFIGLSSNETEELALLAMLHDIGKVAIPDYILEKPCVLNNEEWTLIKQHCEIGYRIALATAEIAYVANLILCHHEHWDGSGYPFGLKQDEIPKLSRIFSIIDAYDVMIYSRPYHKALSKNDAIKELKRCSGSQFDPNICESFVNMLLTEYAACS